MISWLPFVMFLLLASSAILANVLKNAKSDALLFEQDDRTILIFRVLMPASVLLAFVVARLDPWRFQTEAAAGWSAVDVWATVLFVTGLTLRWTAIGSLKHAFTVKVSILKDHQLKTDGVYRWVRHPSYAAMYVYGLGYGLAFHSVLCVFLVLAAVWISTHARIQVEEKVLEQHFGAAYRTYKAKSWRLFPGIY